jgi:hypothetical protein
MLFHAADWHHQRKHEVFAIVMHEINFNFHSSTTTTECATCAQKFFTLSARHSASSAYNMI